MLFKQYEKKKYHFLTKANTKIDSEQVCEGKVKSTEYQRMKEILKFLTDKLLYLYNVPFV